MSTPLATLTCDITAEDLAMDAAAEGEGYPADYVIGPAGSTVRVIGTENEWLEVTGFANDPYAYGFILRSAATL